MHFIYCSQCGAKLEERELGDEGFVPFCSSCQTPYFDMFSSCIIALVINEQNEAALLRQNYISSTYYNLVSGYMKPGETAEETAKREIEEEIGIKVKDIKSTGTYWFEKKDMLMIGFIAHADKSNFNLSKEVDEAHWIPVEKAIHMVHPKGSVSYTLLETYIQAHE